MAVNCFVTEPRRNRVPGVFGMPFASSAMPMPSANRRSPSRLTRADPLKSVPRISLNWEARSGAPVGIPSTDASGGDGAVGMVIAVGGARAAVGDGGAGALVEEQPAMPSTRARTAVANLIETPRAATADTGISTAVPTSQVSRGKCGRPRRGELRTSSGHAWSRSLRRRSMSRSARGLPTRG